MFEKTILREKEDSNLGLTIRLNKDSNGKVYFSVIEHEGKRTCDDCLSEPIFAHVKVTDICNMNCPYCYADIKNSHEAPSTEDLINIINLCDKNGVMNITWTGGEPLCRKDMPSLINYAHKKKMNQTLLTNGVLFDENLMNSLPLDNILFQVSLNEAWNVDKLDIHKKVLENVRRLQYQKRDSIVTIVLEERTIDEYEELFNRLVEEGIQNIRMGYMIPIGRVNPKMMEEYSHKIIALVPQLVCLKQKYADKINVSYQFEENCQTSIFPKRFFMCEGGTTQIFIDKNGDVYPCPLFQHIDSFYCGNVFCDGWNDIWKSQAMDVFRKVEICKGCKGCMSWCRALVFPITGNLSGPTLFCRRGDHGIF